MTNQQSESSSKHGKIVICGATGMVGNVLTQMLQKKGHSLILVGRDINKLKQSFSFEAEFLTWEDFALVDTNKIDTIVNLSGAGVSDKKWTPKYKRIMRESRIHTTQKCVEICERDPQIRLINASAVSAYGFYDHDHEPFNENDKDKRTGTNFLQELIDDWEEVAMKAESFGNAVTLLRTGVVLDKSGGGLSSMASPFGYYMGGPVGTGQQVMSWISLHDCAGAIAFIIANPDLTGPINLVSTGACEQSEFANALGVALHKPRIIRMPSFIIKLSMGQMGEELVLTGQRVLPNKLSKEGFKFRDFDIYKFLAEHYA